MKAKYMDPPLNEARVMRQWHAVRARLDAPRRSAWAWRAGAAFAMAAAIALVVVFVSRRTPVGGGLVAGAVLESGVTSEGTQVTLAEGSHLLLEKDSRVRLTELGGASVRIEVERGGVAIDATHVPGRAFTVVASGHEVRVVGTKFVVRRLAFAVEVRVEVGEVEVRSPDGSTRPVRANETWRSESPQSPTSPSPSPSTSPSPSPSTSTPTSTSTSTSPDPSTDPAPPPSPSPPTDSAKSLFDDAQRARREGRTADAARAYDKLRHAYRSDPRAALAAFELGRLRLDALGDPRGAEEALRDAMALGPASPFREDAEARRVQALARMGDKNGCVRARDAYLTRYPSGVYRNAVGVYCGGP